MKKSLFMKVLALLFVGAGALAYSCSGDDIFEEEEDARSLAKRAMQTRGEDMGGTSSTEAFAAGSYDGRSISGKCSVHVWWTEGYTTGFPESVVKASATVEGLLDGVVVSTTAYWLGKGICGTVYYKYSKKVTYIDSQGYERDSIMRNVSGSDQFNFSPNLTILPDDYFDKK